MRTLKIIFLLLALMMVVSALFACDVGTGDATDSPGASETGSPEPSDTTKPTESTPTDVTDGNELVIFENGEYNFRLICSDMATATEMKVYNDIRNKLKDITGKAPAFETDFQAYDDDGADREGAAILVGETNYEESKEVYEDTKNAECALKVIGNKIVIAFRTDIDATNAYINFTSHFRNSTAERISFPKDVDYKKASNEYLNDLPTYMGGNHEIIDIDDDTYMLYAKGASMNDFLNYYDAAVINGFLPYESREVNGNVFETLITEDKYIYMYYRAYDDSIRASIGPIEMLGQSDCSSGAEEIHEPSLSMIGQIASVDCGQGYIFLLPDGRLIIQDGGGKYSAKPDYIYEAIQQIAPDPYNVVIAAWVISHPHGDHQNGFTEFVDNHGDDPYITLERIITNYISRDMYQYVRDDGAKETNGAAVDRLRQIVKEVYPNTQFVKAHTGQVFNFGSASMEIIYTVEDYLPAEKFNYVNSSSLVIRVTVEDTSVMLLADTTHASGQIIEDMFGSHLKSDMVQLAHHGMAPSNASLYRCIQADVLIWPSTYKHSAERFQQYGSTINAALEYAKDVYIADVEVTTVSLPYTIQNNKNEEMDKIR